MADTTVTISSLITDINKNKLAIANKVKDYGLFTQEEANNAKLAEIVQKMNSIPIHECETKTVHMGTVVTIDAGYHKGCTITAGEPKDVTQVYKLQELTVNSPEPNGTSKTVTLASDGDSKEYYGISKVTINPLGAKYTKVDEATISSDHVLSGKIAYGKDSNGNAKKITGTMEDKSGYWNILTVDEQLINIPKGYHDGTGYMRINTESDYVEPTEEEQVITPGELSVLSSVTVGPIPYRYKDTTGATVTADDVLNGKIAFNNATSHGKVVGKMANNTGFSGVINTATPDLSIAIPKGYHDGNGTVSVTATSKTINCPTSQSNATTITGDDNALLTSVIINPLPQYYANVSDASVDSGSLHASVLVGTTVYAKNSSGGWSKVSGSIPYKGNVSGTIDGYTETGLEYTIPAGYHAGNGKVEFDDSAIIAALQTI